MHTQVNKFESDKALKFSIGIFQTHVFRIFFPGIIFEISSGTWKIQSILSFFLLILKNKKKRKTLTRELFERKFYWKIKATFCMRFMPLPTISWDTSSIFLKRAHNRISSLLLKNRKVFFHPSSLVFNIYINKIYWIFVWIILKCTETFYWLLK